ncbi:restriction endonuclease subunit S [Methanosphaera sp.]
MTCLNSILLHNQVPRLRFKEFTGEWNKYKLDELFNIKAAGDLNKNHFSKIQTKTFNFPVYGNALESKGLLGYTDNPKYSEKCITVTGRGEIGKAFLRNSTFDAVGRLLILTPKIELNLKFLSEVINNTHIFIESTGVPQLTAPSLRIYKVLLPNLDEQKKIASFLLVLDKKISLMEKKLNLYVSMKEYFLERIFSQKIGLFGSKTWKACRLKNLIKKSKAGGTPRSNIKEYYDGTIPFLSINDMTEQGKYITRTEKHISQSGLDNSSAWLVPKNSLLYSMYASVGFVSINNIDLTTSQAIYSIIFEDTVNLEYMYYYLSYYRRYIHKYIETGTQGNLNAKIVQNILVRIPNTSEQEKITEFLNNIDQKIDLSKSELNQMCLFKKYLLQNMFC